MTRRPLVALWAEAPAKVNLALAVTGRRGDGYHTLHSVFLRVALHDHLEAGLADDPSGADMLTIEGAPGLSTQDNLVLRAVGQLRSAISQAAPGGHHLPALRFHLHKHVPAAAGLGGGSSDAAAALRLAMGAWGISLDRARLLATGRQVGADVPFFVAGYGAALVSGVGDVIDSLPAPRPPAGLLLVTAAQRLSTASVFAELDRGRPADRTPSHIPGATEAAADALARALRAGLDGAALLALAPRLRDANDLWPAASRLSPTLAATRDALEQAVGRPALLSGSGPTLVAVYPSHESAAAAAVRLDQDRPAVLHDAIIAATSSSNGGSS